MAGKGNTLEQIMTTEIRHETPSIMQVGDASLAGALQSPASVASEMTQLRHRAAGRGGRLLPASFIHIRRGAYTKHQHQNIASMK